MDGFTADYYLTLSKSPAEWFTACCSRSKLYAHTSFIDPSKWIRIEDI
jgi:hypothetical protein